ncbi:hypothetical protein JW887_01200 [Candidatus Dojkabacteria bacterium]|nr:hypothetical protein [Candidatus Dojkabacteria bacterium]
MTSVLAQFCIVCNKPLDKDDFADYCQFCGNKKGIFPYEVLLSQITQQIAQINGISKEEAEIKAKDQINKSQAAKQGRIS